MSATAFCPGNAVERVEASVLRELVVTTSIAPSEAARVKKVRTISVAPLIGEAIRSIANEESVSKLFD
jgi:ribose-phosphate pyrophosphokinase